jgi:hypothetical protein
MVICRVVVSPRSIDKNEGHRLLLFITCAQTTNQVMNSWLWTG